ncbi:MAG: hypothetical protein PHT16_03630 [Candidatus Pacebacteria bacterium]|nr:hypothetical protein [Candidatus Paceibacterota bacterium]
MSNYTEKDANPMSWNEFDDLINVLIEKINKYFKEQNKQVHVISQLHRTGGIVGSTLAIKMKIIPLLPLQFKYSYYPTKITQIISVPDILVDVPEDMNIILAEGNTSSGSVAKEAVKAIKAKYPKAKIYLATLTKVYGGFEELEGVEKVFYGAMTNERFRATPEEVEKLGLRKGITIFPWENTKEELFDVNAS